MFFFRNYGELPPEFVVVVDVTPTKRNKVDKPYTAIVGYARSMDGARTRIADHLKMLGQTYGGLIEPGTSDGQTFRICRATWETVHNGR